ncbi:hypothetical protein OAG24_00430 [bacterium]|nr:hypothetical protein [bacterium]
MNCNRVQGTPYFNLWSVEGMDVNNPTSLTAEMQASRSDNCWQFQSPNVRPCKVQNESFSEDRNACLQQLRPPVIPNRSYKVFRRGHGYSALSNYNSIP